MEILVHYEANLKVRNVKVSYNVDCFSNRSKLMIK